MVHSVEEDNLSYQVFSESEAERLETAKQLHTVTKDEETATTFSDLSINSSIQQETSRRTMSESPGEVQGYDHEELNRLLDGYYKDRSPKRVMNPSAANIHDRLYKEGQHTAMKRAYAHRQKLEAEKYVEPPKLQLATRSYTPLKERDGQKTHERLYKLGVNKKKQAIQEEAKEQAYYAKHAPKPKIVDKETIKRLYEKSRSYREEGKQRRQKIAKKISRKRDVTPSRSISVTRGAQLYERGLAFTANRDRKIEEIKNAPRESSFPKMRTQTPNRRDLFFEARDEPTPSSRSQRSNTPSRMRSQTPTRTRSNSARRTTRSQTPTRSRSQTPSRSRSQTPNRRLSAQSNYSRTNTPISVAAPKLPRSFKINQVEE